MTNTAMLTRAERRQVQRSAAAIQRHTADADSPLAQLQARANAGPHATSLAALQSSVAQRVANNRTGLPDRLRAGLESLSGRDLSGIRVHYNSPKPAQLAAHAFAQGSNIHLAPGQERHLPHEAWHVVQQMDGRVQPTMQLHGIAINDDSALEREAGVMGARASRSGAAQRISGGNQHRSAGRGSQPTNAPIQRVLKIRKTGKSDYEEYTPATILEPARTAGATEREIMELARLSTQDTEYKYESWDDAIVSVQSLIFGTDKGKGEQSEKTLTWAVLNGYRRFDCAEGYDNIEVLARVLEQEKVPRGAYEIIYKFDVNPGEKEDALVNRLGEVAALFEGWIDSLLIHNLEGSDSDIRTAWSGLVKLKKKGVAREIGVSNVAIKHERLLKEMEKDGIDAVENSVESVIGDDETRTVITKTKAKLYYYDVLGTAKEIGMEPEKGILALGYLMNSAQPRGGMILSSSDEKRQKANLDLFKKLDASDLLEVVGEGLDKIKEWKLTGTCTRTEESDVPERLRERLSRLPEKKALKDLRKRYFDSQKEGKDKEEWLKTELDLSKEDIAVRIPSRQGLKRRYLGMPLVDVLDLYLGDLSCNWLKGQELIKVLVEPACAWRDFKTALTEIVSMDKTPSHVHLGATNTSAGGQASVTGKHVLNELKPVDPELEAMQQIGKKMKEDYGPETGQ